MQITVDGQDLREILRLVSSAQMYAMVDCDTTRAVSLNDLHERLVKQGEQEQDPVCCPLCQEVTCDWDCPNPRGGAQESKPDDIVYPYICRGCGRAWTFRDENDRPPPHDCRPRSLYETTDMMPGSD